ncbi:RNHCP domain-containing protein [Candidatus Dojkabacteria bacterium]|uniref:RNHCP domain-containing protein n=1 Tax=Candidatus Dojkabacteria bacterium TaxID=2099670 RepID=A0A955LA52_9BACT|nr:RNHCP domain-containing protein [Candidatus Dojkabacteria bacterium]
MRKFTKRNESFTCINCEQEVSPHPSSSRDHCPFCLYGLHVDINPGDRANKCKGILKPIGIKNTNRKEQIVFKCEKCGEEVNCITAPDDIREVVHNLGVN